MNFLKIKQEKFPIVESKRNSISKNQNGIVNINKPEQRRLYSSQLQKIIKKNIKNNISFSINNYNNNNTSNRDDDDVYKNINNITPKIIGLNKSIDISRNKSTSFPFKPNYILKTENYSDLKNHQILNKDFNYIENNRSLDFIKKDLDKLNNIYYNNQNINSEFKQKKIMLDNLINKYQRNNPEEYQRELSYQNPISLSNKPTKFNKIFYNNEKNIEHYMKPPISNDTVFNMNLYSQDSNENNVRSKYMNSDINKFSSIYKPENTKFKKIDLLKSIKRNKFYESEESNSIKQDFYETNSQNYEINVLKELERINQQSNYRNFTRNPISIKNRTGQIRDKDTDSDHNINYTMMQKNNINLNSFINTSGQTPSNYSNYTKISNFSKLKNIYKNNRLNSRNLSNLITSDNENEKHEKSLIFRPSHSPIFPVTQKNAADKSYLYNQFLNNSINTPTKVFNFPQNIINNINKQDGKSANEFNSSKIHDNIYSSPNDISIINITEGKNYDCNNLLNNTIKQRILSSTNKNLPSLNNSTNISKEIDKKILNSKIRIISRNVEERFQKEYQNKTKKDDNEKENDGILQIDPIENISSMKSNNFETKLKDIKRRNPEKTIFNKIIPNKANLSDDRNGNKTHKEKLEISNPTSENSRKKEKKILNNEIVDNFNINRANNGIDITTRGINKKENLVKELKKNVNNEIYKENSFLNYIDFNKKVNVAAEDLICKKDRGKYENNLEKNDHEYQDMNLKLNQDISNQKYQNQEKNEQKYFNKNSKDSSQGEYIISESNEIDEAELHGNSESNKNSNCNLYKNEEKFDKNKFKSKENLVARKHTESNYSIKKPLSKGNYQDSKVTILDINGNKDNSDKKGDLESIGEKSELNDSNLKTSAISDQEKKKIENLIRNLNPENVENDNKNIAQLNDKGNLKDEQNKQNNPKYFGIFKEIEEKVSLLQKKIRQYNEKKKNKYKKLMNFWDKGEKNFNSIYFYIQNFKNGKDKLFMISDALVKISVYNIKSKKIYEQKYDFLKVSRNIYSNRKIDLTKMKQMFILIKDQIRISNEEILFTDKFAKNDDEKIIPPLVNQKESFRTDSKKTTDREKSTDTILHKEDADNLSNKLVKSVNYVGRSNISINKEEINSINLNKTTYRNECHNSFFKDESDKKILIAANIKASRLLSINSLNSEVSNISQNSLKNSENKIFFKNSIEREESLDANSFRYKDGNGSQDQMLNCSINVDSRYFYEDISTKTINTCSIKDDEEDMIEL